MELGAVNFLPQSNIKRHSEHTTLVYLGDDASSNVMKSQKRKSGFFQIYSAKHFSEEEERIRQDFSHWNSPAANLDETSDQVLDLLREGSVIFCNEDNYIRKVVSLEEKSVIIILSSAYGRNRDLVKRLTKLKQVILIYRCMPQSTIKKYKTHWSLQGKLAIPAIVSRVTQPSTVHDLDEAGQTILLQIGIIEGTICIPLEENAKEIFIEFCHERLRSKSNYLTYKKQICEFERDYTSTKAIEWYTRPNHFIFRLVNRTCATIDFPTFFKMRFYLRDLYNQIKDLHKDQLKSWFESGIEVYRGVLTSTNELEALKANGALFITRGFISTSANKDVAAVFATKDKNDHTNQTILIHITLSHTDIQERPVAYIGDVSANKHENEILLSMGIVLRLQSIKKNNGSLNYDWELHFVHGQDEARIEKELSKLVFAVPISIDALSVGIPIGLILHRNNTPIINNSNGTVCAKDPCNENQGQLSLDPDGLTPQSGPILNQLPTALAHSFKSILTAPATIVVVVLIATALIATVIAVPVWYTSRKETAAQTCPRISCNAIGSVQNPSPNYQVEHLDFNCSETLSNMTITQTVQRNFNETYAQQYQTFWNYSTNMTYYYTSMQLIYIWYSLPGMYIVAASFPHFVEAQFYYTTGSVRVTSNDTWQIRIQSSCGDLLNLSGTF